MRKIFSIIFALFVSVAAFAETDLDSALSNAALQFSESIEKNSVVAILRISAPTTDLSKYLLDTFTLDTVHLRKQTVVARHNLDMIAKEMQFQLSGEVSDETMQQIGAKTGAKTVIFGEFKPLGSSYSLTLQAFDVTTAAILDMYRGMVKVDDTIAMLAGNKVLNEKGNLVSSDYTSGERFGIGCQNIIGGLGSYRHGHWGDGLFMTVLDVTGAVFIVEYFLLPDYDSNNDEYIYDPAYIFAGLSCIGSSILYGFIRPHWYHKQKVSQVGSVDSYEGLNIGFIPVKNGIATQVSYKIQF